MIIEFIGAPGAGKTTLLPTVIECLHLRGVQPFTVVDGARTVARRTLAGRMVVWLAPSAWREPLLWRVFLYSSMVYRLGFVLRHLPWIWGVVQSQRRRPANAYVRERKVLHWFFRLVGYYAFFCAHLRDDEALILDEGFVHRVVQLNASGVEPLEQSQITRYIDQLPRPDLVLHIDVPTSACEERIYSRGLWERWQGKDPAEISRFVRNARAAVSHAVERIEAHGWPLIAVDNGNPDPERARERVRGELAKFPLEAARPSAWQRSLQSGSREAQL